MDRDTLYEATAGEVGAARICETQRQLMLPVVSDILPKSIARLPMLVPVNVHDVLVSALAFLRPQKPLS